MQKIIRNCVLAGAGLLLAWNGSVALPVALEQIKDKGRPAYVLAYRTWMLSPSDITINLVHVGNDASPVDIHAALGTASDGLEGRSFHTVHLNRWISPRLLISGEAFAEVSRRRASPRRYMDLGASLHTTDGRPLKLFTYSGGFMAGLEEMSASVEAANDGARIWVVGE